MESSIDEVEVDYIDNGNNDADLMILETPIEKEIERRARLKVVKILQNGKESDEATSKSIDKESVVVDFPTKEGCFKKESEVAYMAYKGRLFQEERGIACKGRF
ncbi:hypothetical protein Syun_020078 [Stephania yunnanensis]|uniref:Uncharacterized protein n=1 Tax=Stephania yunnanensis TaxID=152371 RepID=A0AAP0IXP2_9MAGN